jgi:HK97 family phage major capsid protein
MSTDLLDAVKSVGDTVKTFRTDLGELRDRIEGIEALADRPRAGNDSAKELKIEAEYRTEFFKWFRKPHDSSYKHRLSEAQHALVAEVPETKDVLTGTGLSGGYALPKQIDTDITRRVTQLNPFRGLVYNPTASTTDFHTLVDIGDSTSGWSSETGTRSATNAPNLRDRVPTWGELYAYPTASNWSLENLQFNVQQWLVESAGEQFASSEATAIVSGNGTARPTGFTNTTPVTTTDDASPMRAAGTLQYVPLGAYTSPDKINGDTLIDVVHSLKERYLMDSASVAWVMATGTLAKIRKLKTTTGEYIYQESLAAGVPPTILGYPVKLTAAMPAATAGLFPIAFGNWNKGYVLVDRPGTAITVDQVTTPGMTKFYVRRRVGGCIRLNDALRVVKYSST